MVLQYSPNSFHFDNSQSGIDNDLINNLDSESSEYKELNIFKQIFDEDLVQHIVEETNKFYHFLVNNKVLSKHSKLVKWKETNINEMYVFFSFMLLMAHVQKNNIKDYWSKSIFLSTPIFSKIMTQDRFLLLLRILHFCDNRNQISGDRLFKIRIIVESLRKKFRSSYQPHQKVCIDESIVEWKGRLQFKQFIPSKRHRFGIKLFVLCDCKSGFVLDYLIYTGDNMHINFNETLNQSGSVISTLMEPYINKGHIIYMDNWYSSPTLYEYLLNKGTGACGTVKIKRKGMPSFPKKLNNGQCISVISQNPSMLCCKWKDKRDVHMLSTVHKPKMCKTNKKNRQGNIIIKPQSVIDYNENMGLVDKSDMQMSFNTTARKSIKWYKKFFFHLLNLSILNSGIIYSTLEKKPLKLPEFRLKLIEQIINTYWTDCIISPCRVGRKSNDDLPIRLTARHFPSRINTGEQKKKISRRCHVHSHTKLNPQSRKDTTYECVECNKSLCLEPCFKEYHTKLHY